MNQGVLIKRILGQFHLVIIPQTLVIFQILAESVILAGIFVAIGEIGEYLLNQLQEPIQKVEAVSFFREGDFLWICWLH